MSNPNSVSANLPPTVRPKTDRSQSVQATGLTPLSTKPGMKQNLIYALREFQSSVRSLFSSHRPTSENTPSEKISVILAPNQGQDSVAGFMLQDRFVSFDEARKLSKNPDSIGKQFASILAALSTGHHVRTKGHQEKIGSKLYITDDILSRQTGVIAKSRQVSGSIISLDKLKQTGLQLGEIALSSHSSTDYDQWISFRTQLSTIGEHIPAYQALLNHLDSCFQIAEPSRQPHEMALYPPPQTTITPEIHQTPNILQQPEPEPEPEPVPIQPQPVETAIAPDRTHEHQNAQLLAFRHQLSNLQIPPARPGNLSELKSQWTHLLALTHQIETIHFSSTQTILTADQRHELSELKTQQLSIITDEQTRLSEFRAELIQKELNAIMLPSDATSSVDALKAELHALKQIHQRVEHINPSPSDEPSLAQPIAAQLSQQKNTLIDQINTRIHALSTKRAALIESQLKQIPFPNTDTSSIAGLKSSRIALLQAQTTVSHIIIDPQDDILLSDDQIKHLSHIQSQILGELGTRISELPQLRAALISAEIEAVSIPKLNSSSIEQLKQSFHALQSAHDQLSAILTAPTDDISLSTVQVDPLNHARQIKLDLITQQLDPIPTRLVEQTLKHILQLATADLTQQLDQFDTLATDLLTYQVNDDQVGEIQDALHALADFSSHIKSYDQLTPATRQAVLSAYRHQALYINDPETGLLLERTQQLLQDADADIAYLNNRINELANADVSTLFLIQDHVANVTQTTVSESVHLDGIIGNIIQKTLTGSHLETAKIQHALRITARHLCREIAPVLGLNKLTSFAFDPVTIRALTNHPQLSIPSFNIVLGQIMLLQHQLTPFSNLEKALSDAGIPLTPQKIQSYFSQGLRSSASMDNILNTITQFAKRIESNTTLQSLIKLTLNDRPEVWFDRYSQQIISRQLGISGMDSQQLKANKSLIGKQIDLGEAHQKRTRVMGKVVISGKVKDLGKKLLGSTQNAAQLLIKLNHIHDQISALESQIAATEIVSDHQFKESGDKASLEQQLAKLTDTLQTAEKTSNSKDRKIHLNKLIDILKTGFETQDFTRATEKISQYDKEKVFKTIPDFSQQFDAFVADYASKIQPSNTQKSDVAAIKKHRQELQKQVETHYKTLQETSKLAAQNFNPIIESIRLGILQVLSTRHTHEDPILAIQSGQKIDEIAQFVADFGFDNALFSAYGISDARPIRGLIAMECHKFTGPEDFARWMGKAQTDRTEQQIIDSRNRFSAKDEIRQTLGIESSVYRLAETRVQDMKSGERFCLSWGKAHILEVPDIATTVEAAFLGGVGLGLTIGQHSESQFWVEKTETEIGTGYNVYFGTEIGGQLGLNLEILGGAMSVDGAVSGAQNKGFRLRFDTEAAATHFVASVMSGNVESATLGRAAMIFEDHGHALTLNGGVSFQVPNPIADWVPDIDVPFDGLNQALDYIAPTEIGFSLEHQTHRQNSKNLHQTTQTKGSEFNLEINAGIIGKLAGYAAQHFQAKFEFDGAAPSATATFRQEQHITQQFESLSHITTTQTITLNIAAAHPASNQKLALSLLKAGNDPAIQHQSVNTQIQTLFNQSEAGDSLRAIHSLKPNIKWQINELTDPASAQFNPQTAKALLADPTSYTLESIQLLREISRHVEKNLSHNNTVAFIKTTGVSRTVVVGEVQVKNGKSTVETYI